MDVCLFGNVESLHFHLDLEASLIDLRIMDLDCETFFSKVVNHVGDWSSSSIRGILFECISENSNLSVCWISKLVSYFLGKSSFLMIVHLKDLRPIFCLLHLSS